MATIKSNVNDYLTKQKSKLTDNISDNGPKPLKALFAIIVVIFIGYIVILLVKTVINAQSSKESSMNIVKILGVIMGLCIGMIVFEINKSKNTPVTNNDKPV
jgi:uncharacterized protein YacL